MQISLYRCTLTPLLERAAASTLQPDLTTATSASSISATAQKAGQEPLAPASSAMSRVLTATEHVCANSQAAVI